MPDDDLHTRLVAALTARLERAKAATPGPWRHVDYADPEGQPFAPDGNRSTFMGCGSVITMGENVMGSDIAAPSGDCYPRSGYSPKGDMAYIAGNDPAVEIRRVEATLRVVYRHTPVGGVCDHCSNDWHTALAPCQDIRDLAEGEGLMNGDT